MAGVSAPTSTPPQHGPKAIVSGRYVPQGRLATCSVSRSVPRKAFDGSRLDKLAWVFSSSLVRAVELTKLEREFSLRRVPWRNQ